MYTATASLLGTQVPSSNGYTALLCLRLQPVRRYHSTSPRSRSAVPCQFLIQSQSTSVQSLPGCPPALAKAFPSLQRLGRFLFFDPLGLRQGVPLCPPTRCLSSLLSLPPRNPAPAPACTKVLSADRRTDRNRPSHPPQRSALTPHQPANGRPVPRNSDP